MKQVNHDFIANRRKELGIPLREMADLFGLKSPSNYLKYETGVYQIKADMLPALARKLKCAIADFFCS